MEVLNSSTGYDKFLLERHGDFQGLLETSLKSCPKCTQIEIITQERDLQAAYNVYQIHDDHSNCKYTQKFHGLWLIPFGAS
jgi:hypothetical protein